MKGLTFSEAEELFAEDAESLQKKAFACRKMRMGDRMTFYRKPFVPVSVTGTECELSCKHCNKHYLSHMHPATSAEELGRLAASLSDSGVCGLVLSGGTRMDGSVPVYGFADALCKIREETGLKLNAHTGILSDEQARLFSRFLDAALTDVIGDRETIKEVLGLDFGPEDCLRTLKLLREYEVPNLSPHIIVGLRGGKISGELKALDLVGEVDPQNIVIVVFIPTQGTAMGECSPPPVEDVSKIISLARLMHPKKHISLSCVRPGGRYRLELDWEAVHSGVDKVAVPSRAAYDAARKLGLNVEEINESRCCSW